jgi:hypothetical protein
MPSSASPDILISTWHWAVTPHIDVDVRREALDNIPSADLRAQSLLQRTVVDLESTCL